MKQTPTIPETFLGIGYTRDRGGRLEAVRVPVPWPAVDHESHTGSNRIQPASSQIKVSFAASLA
jgi:hypothetical protein